MSRLNYWLVEFAGGRTAFHAGIAGEVERGDLVVSDTKDPSGFTMTWRKARPVESAMLRVVKFTGSCEVRE